MNFAQFLKDNPLRAGTNLLGNIASEIRFDDPTAASGYWIGFFSFLEQLIYTQATQQPVFEMLKDFQMNRS